MELKENIDFINMTIELSTIFFQSLVILGIYKLYINFNRKKKWLYALQGVMLFTLGSLINTLDIFLKSPNSKIMNYSLDIFHFIGIILFLIGASHIVRDLVLMSQTDELTKLYNKGYVTAILEKELPKAIEQNKELSIVFLDINDFKVVNDTFGHEEGNQLLSNIAECIRRGVRSTDIIARYGGDEFIILLINTKKSIAFKILERIQDSIQEKYDINVSGGVSSAPIDGITVKDLIHVADKRMYHNKSHLKSS